MLSDIEGKKFIKLSRTSDIKDSQTSAEMLAQELLDSGGGNILEEIRRSRNDEVNNSN